MPDGKPDAVSPDLELEVGVGVPVELKQLVSISTTFERLINEVAEAYTGKARAIRWFVEVKEGSVRLPLRAERASEQVAPSAIREVPPLIADGLAMLEREAARPDYFNDKAVEVARTLAGYVRDEFPLAVRNGGERIELSQQLSVNAGKVLGRPRTSFGTVEGKLESLSVHGANEFSIWLVDGTRVTCSFGKYLTLDEVLPAVGKRVAARGQIKAHPHTGEPESVEVHYLRVLGSEPVSADEVRGILKDCETAEDW